MVDSVFQERGLESIASRLAIRAVLQTLDTSQRECVDLSHRTLKCAVYELYLTFESCRHCHRVLPDSVACLVREPETFFEQRGKHPVTDSSLDEGGPIFYR